MVHNVDPYAHLVMQINGNDVAMADESANLDAHKENSNAHSNLIVDGGII